MKLKKSAAGWLKLLILHITFLFHKLIINTMSTPDLIQQLSLQEIDFNNDATESLVERLLTANTQMHISATAFERDANVAGIAPLEIEKTAKAVVQLAGAFGRFYDLLNADEVEQVQNAFGDIYKGETAELDASGQTLFNNVIAFIATAKEVNTAFNA